MVDLKNFSSDLIERDGIFFANKNSEVSYPESGNDDFFQIEENSFWFTHRRNAIAKAIKKYSPENIFFDIGGGNGYISKALEDDGFTTVLVEPGISGCLNAKKRNLRNIVCATLENANFKKGAIGSIGIFDVIEHIEDDIAFLTSLHTFLQNEGYIYITVPAFQALWSNQDEDAGHFRRYTVGNLEEKLIRTGFQIEYSTYLFSVLPIAVFLFRTIPSKLGFNKNSADFSAHQNAHSNNRGFVNAILGMVWKWELKKITAGKKIIVGGSCFIIAKKIKL